MKQNIRSLQAEYEKKNFAKFKQIGKINQLKTANLTKLCTEPCSTKYLCFKYIELKEAKQKKGR